MKFWGDVFKLPNAVDVLVKKKDIEDDKEIENTESLKCSASLGHDRLSYRFIKRIIHFKAQPLCHVFNLSLYFYTN